MICSEIKKEKNSLLDLLMKSFITIKKILREAIVETIPAFTGLLDIKLGYPIMRYTDKFKGQAKQV